MHNTYFLFFQVKIHVEDINDNKPQFEITEMKKSILEHVADGKEIATFHATDPDISDNARFLYSLNDPSGAFEINPHTGSLTMKDGAKFDREKFKNGFVDLVIGTLELKPSVLPLNQDQAKKTADSVLKFCVKNDQLMHTSEGQNSFLVRLWSESRLNLPALLYSL